VQLVNRVGELISTPWRGDLRVDRFVWAAGMATFGLWLWLRWPDAGFVRDFLAAGAILGAASQLPASVLPWVRLLTGAVVATLGALTMLLMGDAISRDQFDGANPFWGALVIALGFLVIAGWFTQMRILRAERAEQDRRDQLAAERHAELLAAVGARQAPVASRPRATDLAWLVLGLALARRRRLGHRQRRSMQ